MTRVPSLEFVFGLNKNTRIFEYKTPIIIGRRPSLCDVVYSLSRWDFSGYLGYLCPVGVDPGTSQFCV